MPRTNVVGTTAPPGSGAQQCAQASECEHITDSTSGSAATTAHPIYAAGGMSDAICHQCGKPLPATARRHARICSPAHRAAYHRSLIAAGMARVRFPVAPASNSTSSLLLAGV